VVDNIEPTSVAAEGQLPPMEPKAVEPEKPAEGAVKEAVEGAGNKEEKVEAPVLRTYSEVEWNTRQSKIDKQIAKFKEDSQKEVLRLQQVSDAAETRAREAEYSAFLRKAEEDGGDVPAAKAIVEERRRVDARVAELQKTEAWIKEQSALLNLAGKGKQAQELVKQFSLSEESLEELLDSENPVEMENKALKLHVAKLKVEQKPPMQVDPGRGSGKQRDFSAMPASEALGILMGEAK